MTDVCHQLKYIQILFEAFHRSLSPVISTCRLFSHVHEIPCIYPSPTPHHPNFHVPCAYCHCFLYTLGVLPKSTWVQGRCKTSSQECTLKGGTRRQLSIAVSNQSAILLCIGREIRFQVLPFALVARFMELIWNFWCSDFLCFWYLPIGCHPFLSYPTHLAREKKRVALCLVWSVEFFPLSCCWSGQRKLHFAYGGCTPSQVVGQG